jgi:hypothetical protein
MTKLSERVIRIINMFDGMDAKKAVTHLIANAVLINGWTVSVAAFDGDPSVVLVDKKNNAITVVQVHEGAKKHLIYSISKINTEENIQTVDQEVRPRELITEVGRTYLDWLAVIG